MGRVRLHRPPLLLPLRPPLRLYHLQWQTRLVLDSVDEHCVLCVIGIELKLPMCPNYMYTM